MNGKGDTRRPENGNRFRRNYDAINWGVLKKGATRVQLERWVKAPIGRLKPGTRIP